MIFQRKLYTQWFLFLDDLTVATGRPKSLPPGPSGAADVVESNLAFSVAASVERETKDRVGEPCPPLCLSGVPETARLPSPEGLPAGARERAGGPSGTPASPVAFSYRRLSIPQAGREEPSSTSIYGEERRAWRQSAARIGKILRAMESGDSFLCLREVAAGSVTMTAHRELPRLRCALGLSSSSHPKAVEAPAVALCRLAMSAADVKEDSWLPEELILDAEMLQYPPPTRCGCMNGRRQCRLQSIVGSEPPRCHDCFEPWRGVCQCDCSGCWDSRPAGGASEEDHISLGALGDGGRRGLSRCACRCVPNE